MNRRSVGSRSSAKRTKPPGRVTRQKECPGQPGHSKQCRKMARDPTVCNKCNGRNAAADKSTRSGSRRIVLASLTESCVYLMRAASATSELPAEPRIQDGPHARNHGRPWQLILQTGDSRVTQNVIYASLAVAGLMSLACLADIVTERPFGGQITMDIIFLLASGLIAFTGFDCLKGIRRK